MAQSLPSEPKGQALEELTQVFKALGDSSRVRSLFHIFSTEACVGDISRNLQMSEAAVSHHLRILRMNGLVRRQRNGKEMFYQLNDNHVRFIIAQGCEHIQEFLDKNGKVSRNEDS